MNALKTEISRRRFLTQSTLAVGATALAAPSFLRGQNLNGKIRVACVGVGGKGDSDCNSAAGCGGEIVGLAENRK